MPFDAASRAFDGRRNARLSHSLACVRCCLRVVPCLRPLLTKSVWDLTTHGALLGPLRFEGPNSSGPIDPTKICVECHGQTWSVIDDSSASLRTCTRAFLSRETFECLKSTAPKPVEDIVLPSTTLPIRGLRAEAPSFNFHTLRSPSSSQCLKPEP